MAAAFCTGASLSCASVLGMGDPVRPSAIDRALRPVHAWVWLDPHRRGRKLLRFAETEADGARDLSRAAELTGDPLLRRLFLRHAEDELRHASLFRARDEAFHMSYTHAQLARVAARRSGARLWQARAGRLWKAYLRGAASLASVLGTLLLCVQYFVLLPPFAFLARRAARREPEGFVRA